METEYPTYRVREARIRFHCARLGTTFPRTATCLVLGSPGETWTTDATDHGQGAMQLASRPLTTTHAQVEVHTQHDL